MTEALFYEKLPQNRVKCTLCPSFCELSDSKYGNCGVRKNVEGTLKTSVYGKISALAADPVEKKPLYHFYPGRKILSVGSYGCNFHCLFCQNYPISQTYQPNLANAKSATPSQIVDNALKISDNIGIAFTYNEPFISYEFMLETAELACEKQLKNVIVSNGYINSDPLEKILPYIHTFNIDLKAFNNDFYKKVCKGELKSVQQSLKTIAKSKSHLEITCLIIPGLNDSEQEFSALIHWVKSELGDIPLHISRYFPQYKMNTAPTSEIKLGSLYAIARSQLSFVYTGNLENEKMSATWCPACNTNLISRKGYWIKSKTLTPEGKCPHCGQKVYGCF